MRSISADFQIVPNVEVSRGALGPTGRAPRRYGLPFLYEKIIPPGRNGKTCNEARMSYGCGPEGSRSDFQGIPSETRVKPRRKPLKPRSRWSGIRAQHESESELPPGANDYETTALSASPIVRDICHNFSIG